MVGTKRTPLTRGTRAQITARAVEIFVRELEPRRKRCACERVTKERWTGLRECKSCQEWWTWHGRLADEFTKPYPPPWHWPLVPSPQGHSSEPGVGNELQENLAAELREAARNMAREARGDVEIIGDSAIDSPAPSGTPPAPPTR